MKWKSGSFLQSNRSFVFVLQYIIIIVNIGSHETNIDLMELQIIIYHSIKSERWMNTAYWLRDLNNNGLWRLSEVQDFELTTAFGDYLQDKVLKVYLPEVGNLSNKYPF